MVVVSDHHSDHYGGMDDVIRAFEPRIFLASDSSHTTPYYLKLLTLVRDCGMQAIFPTDAPLKIELVELDGLSSCGTTWSGLFFFDHFAENFTQGNPLSTAARD